MTREEAISELKELLSQPMLAGDEFIYNINISKNTSLYNINFSLCLIIYVILSDTKTTNDINNVGQVISIISFKLPYNADILIPFY